MDAALPIVDAADSLRRETAYRPAGDTASRLHKSFRLDPAHRRAYTISTPSQQTSAVKKMQRSLPSWQLGSLVLGTALLLTDMVNAQAVPEGKTGNPDSGQTQRERHPDDLSPIDKPKPEVEIFVGPDLGGTPPMGIIIVPDEAVQTPSPPAPPAKEEDSSPKKKND